MDPFNHDSAKQATAEQDVRPSFFYLHRVLRSMTDFAESDLSAFEVVLKKDPKGTTPASHFASISDLQR